MRVLGFNLLITIPIWIALVSLVTSTLFFAAGVYATPTHPIGSSQPNNNTEPASITSKAYWEEEHGHLVQLDWSGLEPFWMSLHAKYQPFSLFMWFYLSLIINTLIAGGAFIWVEQSGILDKYKIQPSQHNDWSKYWICIKNLFYNNAFVVVPMIAVGYPIFLANNITWNKEFPSWYVVLLQQILFFIGEDFFEFWLHRLLHVGPLYRYVHKVHHYFKAPFGLSGSFAHPIEIVVLGMATFAPALILRPHTFSFYIWIQLRNFDAVITHCGFELPFNFLHYLGPIYGGTKFHDFHHTSLNYNFASRFTLLDKLCGTYVDPDKFKAE